MAGNKPTIKEIRDAYAIISLINPKLSAEQRKALTLSSLMTSFDFNVLDDDYDKELFGKALYNMPESYPSAMAISRFVTPRLNVLAKAQKDAENKARDLFNSKNEAERQAWIETLKGAKDTYQDDLAKYEQDYANYTKELDKLKYAGAASYMNDLLAETNNNYGAARKAFYANGGRVPDEYLGSEYFDMLNNPPKLPERISYAIPSGITKFEGLSDNVVKSFNKTRSSIFDSAKHYFEKQGFYPKDVDKLREIYEKDAKNPLYWRENARNDDIAPWDMRSEAEQANIDKPYESERPMSRLEKVMNDIKLGDKTLGDEALRRRARAQIANENLEAWNAQDGRVLGIGDKGILFQLNSPKGSNTFLMKPRDTKGGLEYDGYDIYKAIKKRKNDGMSDGNILSKYTLTDPSSPIKTWYRNKFSNDDLAALDPMRNDEFILDPDATSKRIARQDELVKDLTEYFTGKMNPYRLKSANWKDKVDELAKLFNIGDKYDELRNRYTRNTSILDDEVNLDPEIRTSRLGAPKVVPEKEEAKAGEDVFDLNNLTVSDYVEPGEGTPTKVEEYKGNAYDYINEFVKDKLARQKVAKRLVGLTLNDIAQGIGKHKMYKIKELMDEFGLKPVYPDRDTANALPTVVTGDYTRDWDMHEDEANKALDELVTIDKEWHKDHAMTKEKANKSNEEAAQVREVSVTGKTPGRTPGSKGNINNAIRIRYDKDRNIERLTYKLNGKTYSTTPEGLKKLRDLGVITSNPDFTPLKHNEGPRGHVGLSYDDDNVAETIDMKPGSPLYDYIGQFKSAKEDGELLRDDKGNPLRMWVPYKELLDKYDPDIEHEKNAEAWDKAVNKYAMSPEEIERNASNAVYNPDNKLNKRLYENYGNAVPNNPVALKKATNNLSRAQLISMLRGGNSDDAGAQMLSNIFQPNKQGDSDTKYKPSEVLKEQKKGSLEQKRLNNAIDITGKGEGETKPEPEPKEAILNHYKAKARREKLRNEAEGRADQELKNSKDNADLRRAFTSVTNPAILEQSKQTKDGNVTKVTVKPSKLSKPGQQAKKASSDARQESKAAVAENQKNTNNRARAEQLAQIKKGIYQKIAENAAKRNKATDVADTNSEVSDARMKNIGHLASAVSFRPGEVR